MCVCFVVEVEEGFEKDFEDDDRKTRCDSRFEVSFSSCFFFCEDIWIYRDVA